jgi:hypothetical protein
MPDCAASGYALYTEEKLLMKFDKESNTKVAEFLKKTDSKLKVVVEVKQVGGELSLVSIKNAPGIMEKGEQTIMEKGKEKMMEQGTKGMMKGGKSSMPGMP